MGAERAESVATLAARCESVFLSLPGPPQIRDVVLGEAGLLAHKGELKRIVDLSTNAIALNREIAEVAAARGVDYLDAPVSGGKNCRARRHPRGNDRWRAGRLRRGAIAH